MFGAFEGGVRRILGASAIGVGASFFLSTQPAFCADGQPGPAADETGAVEAPGYKAYLDPSTGKLSSAPPSGAAALIMSAAEKNAASTSSAGLLVEPAATGGFKVHLQGRFQSPMLAKADPEGKVTTYHPHPFAITKGSE